MNDHHRPSGPTLSSLIPAIRRGATLIAIVLTACGPSDGDDSPSLRSAEQAVVGQQSLTIAFKLPTGTSIQDVSAASSGLLVVGDRTKAPGMLVSTANKVEVGHDAKVRQVTAKTQVVLRDRVNVSGNVTSGGSVVKGNGTVITGTTSTNAAIALKEVTWTVKAPQASLGTVSLEPGTSSVLPPNTYGNLTVKGRAKLSLETGVYVFNSILIEPQAKLLLDSSQGPVQIYAKTGLTFRGAIATATVGIPQVILAYLGNQTAYVESSFTGVLVAPNAEVRFQAAQPNGHRVFAYAKTLRFEPDTILSPLTFDWVSLIGLEGYQPPGADVPAHPMEASPVQMWATTDGASNDALTQTTHVSEPITFALPESYPVRGGMIANGEVLFTFDQGGPSVTCTYQGGSTTSAPTTPEELTAGLELEFESCTDGLPASATRTASSFTLTVDPVPGIPVSVASPMIRDGYCSEEIPLLSAAETYEMASTFGWNAATKVAELDDLGRPTLFYAWIYVRDKEDMLALRQLLIHVLKKPLFTEELHALAGRCGTITNPGDGTGAFVPALIPGKTYNKLIDALTSPDIEGGRTIFDAVILRTVPAAARTPQGSVKLEPLAESGFRYLNYEPNPNRPPHEFELDMGVAAAIAGIVEWVAQAARDVGQWFIGALGDIDKELRGRVPVTIDVNVITQDPAFGPNALAIRGWGSYGTTPLSAPGLEARIEQWFLNAPIPSMTQGHTNLYGRAELAAVPAGTRGSGFCLELSTSSAMVTDFLLPSTLCDFRVWDPDNAPPGSRDLEDFKLGHISQTKGVQMRIDDPRLMGLVQADDVYQWARSVASFSVPRRAKILSGFHADTFSRSEGSKKLLFAPCLGYGNTLSDTLLGSAMFAGSGVGAFVGGTPLGSAIGIAVAAVYASTILTSDIVMPLNSSLPTSREVMSHEYGHFLFCSLLQVPNPNAVSYLNWATIASEGLGKAAPVRYTNEAMADYFTGQVVGGHDYRWLNGTSGRYCIPPACQTTTPPSCTGAEPPHCWDENHRSYPTNNESPAGVARAASLIHDIFDGQPGAVRHANRPNDGDSWTPGSSSTQLVFSEIGYNNTDSALDRVALPGPAIIEIAQLLAVDLDSGGAADIPLGDEKLHDSLNTVMEQYGVNWCDRCQVLALHSDHLPAETVADLHRTCLLDPRLASIGPPPVPLGRLDAARCTQCPPGEAADSTGVCGNNCPADVVLDGLTIALVPTTFATSTSLPNDTCPDVFVLRIENVDALPARGASSVGTDIKISPDDPETCERPYEMRQEVWSGSTNQLFSQVTFGNSPDCSGDPFCVPFCENLPEFSVSGTEIDQVEYRVPVDNFTSVLVHPNLVVK